MHVIGDIKTSIKKYADADKAMSKLQFCTVIALSIGTPFKTIYFVLGFDIVQSSASWCVLDVAVYVAISVDPAICPNA